MTAAHSLKVFDECPLCTEGCRECGWTADADCYALVQRLCYASLEHEDPIADEALECIGTLDGDALQVSVIAKRALAALVFGEE